MNNLLPESELVVGAALEHPRHGRVRVTALARDAVTLTVKTGDEFRLAIGVARGVLKPIDLEPVIEIDEPAPPVETLPKTVPDWAPRDASAPRAGVTELGTFHSPPVQLWAEIVEKVHAWAEKNAPAAQRFRLKKLPVYAQAKDDPELQDDLQRGLEALGMVKGSTSRGRVYVPLDGYHVARRVLRLTDEMVSLGISDLSSEQVAAVQGGSADPRDYVREAKRLLRIVGFETATGGGLSFFTPPSTSPGQSGPPPIPAAAAKAARRRESILQERRYQADALAALTRVFAEHDRAALALPTGSGKTTVAAKWLTDHVLAEGRRVLWVAHRPELLALARKRFERFDTKRALSISAWTGEERDDSGALVLASTPAMSSPPSGGFDFLVIDEAHHGPAADYHQLRAAVGAAKELGLAATPTRLDGKALGYDIVAYQMSLAELVAEGHLARPRPVLPATVLSFEMAEEDGDFTEASLARLDDDTRNAIIAHHYSDNAKTYGRTLVFAINDAHAGRLAKAFTTALPSTRVEVLSSADDAGRRSALVRELDRGKVSVLIECSAFADGADCPNIETVVLTRPTMSVTRYVQMIERGTRTTPTKKSFNLVDFEDQLSEHQDRVVRPWVLGHEYHGRAKVPEAPIIDRDRLPPFLLEAFDATDLEEEDLAGYVLYESDGVETGFLVYASDEVAVRTLLQRVKELPAAAGDMEVLRVAQAVGEQMPCEHLRLRRLVTVAFAAHDGDAPFVPFDRPLPKELDYFLDGSEVSAADRSDLMRDFDDIAALIKFRVDPAGDEQDWRRIFGNERDAFFAAVEDWDESQALKGPAKMEALDAVYDRLLRDSHLTRYEWTRFALGRDAGDANLIRIDETMRAREAD